MRLQRRSPHNDGVEPRLCLLDDVLDHARGRQQAANNSKQEKGSNAEREGVWTQRQSTCLAKLMTSAREDTAVLVVQVNHGGVRGT